MRQAAFVISLERATERFARAKTLLSQVPFPAEILPATDGSAMAPEEIGSVYQRFLLRPRYPYKLRSGEIGCFLSHRRAWQQIVDRNLDAALILEDDVAVDQQQLNDAMDLASTLSPTPAYIQLPVRRLPKSVRQVARSAKCRLVCPQVTPLRTSGQWVTQAAALRLLKCTEQFDRPVDTFLQMHWHTGIRLLALDPCGLSDLTGELGTTIGVGKRRGLKLSELSRAVSRSWYRFQIAQRSERKAG